MVKMTESQQRELKAFLDQQEQLRSIKPSMMDDEVVLWISTSSIIVKATVDKSYGSVKYIVDAGDHKLPRNDMCISIDCFYPRLNHTLKDYLGFGLLLVLQFSNGSTVTYGEIENVTVVGKRNDGQTYEYEVWET